MLRPNHIYTFFIVFPVGLKARYGLKNKTIKGLYNEV
jgi:hypothetical protein